MSKTKTTQEMIEVMQAFVDGKEIQYFYEGCWDTTPNPAWDWDTFDYRVKPQSKKRPMTFEEVVAYWKKHRTEIYTVAWGDGEPEITFITGIEKSENYIMTSMRQIDYCDFIEWATKEDGSKFEVEIK